MIAEIQDVSDVDVEKRILTGMISNTDFLKRIAPIIKPENLDIEGARRVCDWVLKYFNKYEKAPVHAISSILKRESRRMDETETEIVQILLKDLSDDYVRSGSSENTNYLFDDACSYLKKQTLYRKCDEVMTRIENNDMESAENLWAESILSISSNEDSGLDPFDPDVILNLTNPDYRFSTSLGIPELDRKVGPIRSEWLVMWMGPMKRGKTQVLTHIAATNAMAGYNVLFVSLESGYGDIAERFWMNVGSLRSRKGRPRIDFPYYSKNGKRVLYRKRKRPLLSADSVHKVARKYRRSRSGQLWIKSFPAFSAGVRELRNYLNVLEATERLSFHVIVVDYLGAMKPPNRVTGRDVYDHNSKELKALSQERKAVVISAHQGNRATLEKMNMSPTDIPEDVRILANVDVLLGLNQNEEEKEAGVMRLNVLMHRFRRFNRLKQVEILQALEAGQFYLMGRNVNAPKPKRSKLKRESMNEKEEDYTED